ncbi:MAG TPA: hypothetical protein PKN64_08015, partial [Casimicrobium sp.]|nr:hypothetical protein [Casimicrobium sp.]
KELSGCSTSQFMDWSGGNVSTYDFQFHRNHTHLPMSYSSRQSKSLPVAALRSSVASIPDRIAVDGLDVKKHSLR